MGKNSK